MEQRDATPPFTGHAGVIPSTAKARPATLLLISTSVTSYKKQKCFPDRYESVMNAKKAKKKPSSPTVDVLKTDTVCSYFKEMRPRFSLSALVRADIPLLLIELL